MVNNNELQEGGRWRQPPQNCLKTPQTREPNNGELRGDNGQLADVGILPEAPMGPSCPVQETMTLLSITLGSMHICVSWLRDTSVQLVTAPATCRPFTSFSLITRSSTAVALNSLMLGACSHVTPPCISTQANKFMNISRQLVMHQSAAPISRPDVQVPMICTLFLAQFL